MVIVSFFTTSKLPTGMHRIGWRGGASHTLARTCQHARSAAGGRDVTRTRHNAEATAIVLFRRSARSEAAAARGAHMQT